MPRQALALVAVLPLLIAVACGSGNPPTQPSTPIIEPGPPATPPPLASDIAGEYTLTVTASASCSLPAELRQRTYTAEVAEYTWGVSVRLSGARFLQGLDYVTGTRNGNVIDLDIVFCMGCGMAELMDDGKLLYYQGKAHTTIAGRNITGTFSGLISLYEDPSQLFRPDARRIDCVAADHGIEFVRR